MNMDIPRPIPRNARWRRVKRNAVTAVILLAAVMAVGSLPAIVLYFFIPKDERAAADAGPMQVKSPSAKATPLVAFINVNVIPMDGERVLSAQTVVVRDGRIVEIGPADRTMAPDDALKVDGAGRYLLPGFADMHIHLQGYDDASNHAMLQLFVATGVTTVLNLYGMPGHLELRDKVARGELLGPTIFTSGPFISDAPRYMPTPEEAERAVIEQKRAGYDIIKIHGDFSAEAYRRLFEAARKEKIRVIGHAPRNLGAMAMVEQRQDAVAHSEEYLYSYFYFGRKTPVRDADEETRLRFIAEQEKRIPEIARATAGARTWVVANLSAYKTIGQQAADISTVLARPEMKYVPPRIYANWTPQNNTYVKRFSDDRSRWILRANYGLLEKLVRGFRDEGVRLIAGTDAPIPSIVPGYSIHDELQYLVEAGLTPYEALKTATSNAAEFLGIADGGRIAAGNRADLVLLESNPFEEIASTRRIAGVMARGRWLGSDDLQNMLKELLASYTRGEL
jgi:imidazolonepropionase-like amidohydrolase